MRRDMPRNVSSHSPFGLNKTVSPQPLLKFREKKSLGDVWMTTTIRQCNGLVDTKLTTNVRERNMKKGPRKRTSQNNHFQKTVEKTFLRK